MSFAGNVLFGLCALVALLSAVGVVVMRSPIRAAMSLLAHIVALAGLFLTLHAHLLAALQLLVYAGAVVVLFVFVIMLIGARVPEPPPERGWVVKATAAALVGVLTFGLAAAVATFEPARPTIAACAADADAECTAFGGVDAFSRELYRGGMVPFELISVLLTVAIVGAIGVARGRTRAEAASARRRHDAHQAEVAAPDTATEGAQAHS